MSLGKKILLAKPRTYGGSLIMNILGWQVVRIFVFWVWRVMRTPKQVDPRYTREFAELSKRGAVMVPNFFPPADYAYIKSEFDRLKPLFEPDGTEIGIPHVDRMSIYDKRVPERFRSLILNAAMVRDVGRAYLNRDYHFPLHAYLTNVHIAGGEVGLPQNGGTNNLHMDVPARVYKAFFYIDDVDEPNGAMRYAFGTHQHHALWRLWFEYLLSVRYAWNRYHPDPLKEYRPGLPWVRITDEEEKHYRINPEPLRAKGNTMALADVGAFHRRGVMTEAGERHTVEINFREVETIRNNLFPLEKLTRKLLRLPPANFEKFKSAQ